MIILLCFLAAVLSAAPVSPLTARGYTVLPVPQKVVLKESEFALTDGWRVVLDRGVKPDDVAVESLKERLSERFHLTPGGNSGGAGVIRLSIAPKSVEIGEAAG